MAIISLIMQFVLVEKYGGFGVACAISGALIVGNVIVMNIYYHKKQAINMIAFWKEILKMALVPFVLTTISFLFLLKYDFNTPIKLIYGIAIYSIFYLPLFWSLSMNSYERQLILNPIRRLALKVYKKNN